MKISTNTLVLFPKTLCCNDSRQCWHHWERAVQSPTFPFGGYIVYSTCFIFCLNVFLVYVCSKDLLTSYLLCWPRGRGTGLVSCVHTEISISWILQLFFDLIFCYCYFRPTLFTQPRPLPIILDPRHLT